MRLAKSRKEEYVQEVLETFRKVEINIPLLDAIKQIPKYAKFLKELCTNKRMLRIDEKVRVGENVSAVIKRTLSEKRADPGMFILPCVIGNKRIDHAMLDLGASINVMPYSIYCALRLGPLKETRVVIQLVDRSNAYPEGIVEDVLVQVNDLIFPTDFYILKMEEYTATSSAPLLLGRLFMKTTKTKIDVDEGTLSIEFDGEIEVFGEEDMDDELEYKAQLDREEEIDASYDTPEPEQEAPELELKTPPNHLKYAYLGEKETLPIIIAKGLTEEQEERLIKVLKDHKEAIG
ncbi:PREDICTED: uncharacterized protein LOC104589927 [Nelumbo nucifera]|uniref:Uncharacterized protein LOC104589927 n=1 Tax=Nelumbo nucifera TaxID=4432 RepID=A0A1U7Z121_NELNU|nr:PREDICTED: uncharacterized protein LOC104589927 [Nelumbo nucifera]